MEKSTDHSYEFKWRSAPGGETWRVRMYVEPPAIVDFSDWQDFEELASHIHSEEFMRGALESFGEDRNLTLHHYAYEPDGARSGVVTAAYREVRP